MFKSLLFLITLSTAEAIVVTKYTTFKTTNIETTTSTKFYTTTRIVYHTTTGTLTAPAVEIPTSLDTSFQTEILNLHNELRTLHGVPELSWSQTLYEYAQAFANEYVCNGILEHSDLSYGENLALGYNTTSAVMAWYTEYTDYDYAAGTYSADTGHFTQLVWKNTTELGCAYVTCGAYYGQYTVCEYDAPGNVIGYFLDNVFPPQLSTILSSK